MNGPGGHPLDVWCEYVSAAPSAGLRLVDALREAGVVCRDAGPLAAGPGLLLFRALTAEVHEKLRDRSRGGMLPVIAVAAGPLTRGAGWDLLASGALDVIEIGDVRTAAEAIAARFRRCATVERLLDAPVVRRNLVGDSPRWRTFLANVVEGARFSALPVLIGGETGSGKELVARLIHTLDGRVDKKELITLDCTTVVPELSGSEFFGHERGAYTGAAAPRDGAFALADGGSLFLDEVGELPALLQAELLRAVQEGTYKRVGGNAWHRTSFRHLRDASRSASGERCRPVSPRPLLPHRRVDVHGAAAA